MKLFLRNATVSDAHSVLSDLSDISQHELVSVFGEKWKALHTIKQFLAAGPAETLVDGQGPLWVFGHMRHVDVEGARVTWFLASRRYFQMGKRGVLHARRYLDRLRRKYPGTVFYTYTRSPHPDTDRWFRILGFSPIYSAPYGFKGYVLPVLASCDRRDARPVSW